MSPETSRYFINRIIRRKTQAGQDVVDFYGGGEHSKLRYPVLTLFDLTELTVIGVDPNALGKDEYHCRFWAYYEEGEKKTSEGNLYKNVLYLEPIGPSPSPAAVADTDRILDAMRILYKELRDIKESVQAIQAGKPAPPPPAAPTPTPRPKPATPVAEPPLPQLAENEARDLFYALVAPAIASKQLSTQTANDFAQAANGGGWNVAVAKLQARLGGQK